MKKIKIDLMSRVEGHGGILVDIEKDRVKEVKVAIYEGPRLFEQLLIGKTPDECLNIVPRICAICTVSHRYAAIRAHEKALGIQVPKKVALMRLLMHLGEIIESNSLHVFVLALPDFVGASSMIGLLEHHKDIVITGLKIKEFGNLVMRKTTARMMHGENACIGGFGTYLSSGELEEIRAQAQQLIPFASKSLEFLADTRVPAFCKSHDDLTFMCLNAGEEFGFIGDTVLISRDKEHSTEDYEQLTNERVVAHSFAKRCTYKKDTFMVGALARVNLLGDRLTGGSQKWFKRLYTKEWRKNPLYNNHAQLLEILYALEKIPALVDEMNGLEDPPLSLPAKRSGEATGAIEAPRGILYHHYAVKDNLITGADIITPTDQNLDEMERSIMIAAENLLKRSSPDIRNSLEMVARAYDPCISCSAHLVHIRRS
jgi:sulfhydrogenase subunit alpha